MTRHTPRPVVDIATAIPELTRHVRRTVRLHPRRGEPGLDASKIGGRFLWPADEPWPNCEEHGSSLVPVLQLRADDVPELGFRNDSDLFQLLWCPNSHERLEPHYAPMSRAYWRRRPLVGDLLGEPPPPGPVEDWYLPAPCELHLERVDEYPHAFQLADFHPELWAVVESSQALSAAIPTIKEFGFDDPGTLYQYWLSVADGTKVAGHPNWHWDPVIPRCVCGGPMEYLLTIACEFDGGTWGRWLAEEERSVWGGDPFERFKVQDATNLSTGLAGGVLNYFVCRTCREFPISAVYQR